MNRFVLASGSPRRKELLAKLGIEYDVCVSDVDEHSDKTDPEQLVKELALLKAGAVYDCIKADRPKDTIVIGADTVVYHNGRVLGKPANKAGALDMLRELSGDTHSVYTGVAIITSDWEYCFAEETRVSFYELSDEEILSYIETGDPLDKAGSYGIQGPFARYVRGIAGDYNNVVGLPAARLYQELKAKGVL